MAPLALFTLVVLGLSWIYRPVGAGVSWDALNAPGFVALAAIFALHVDDLRNGSTGPVRESWAQHAWLGHTALALVVAHAVGLLLYDPIVLEYLTPGAPAYMWAGVAATLVLAAGVWSARMPQRLRLFGNRDRFRRLHRGLGAGVVVLSVWHVAGSGFYLGHALVNATLVALATWITVAPRTLDRSIGRVAPELGRWSALAVATVLAALHTTLRNL
jgi:hypothetical protein